LQPAFGERPFPFHGGRRHLQRPRDLFYGQSTEEAHLDDLFLVGIDNPEPLERLIDLV